MTLHLRTHAPDECSGPFCVIHNPSDHPLNDAPMHWRSDKGVMERICPHGDRKSTRLNSSHASKSRMPSSA